MSSGFALAASAILGWQMSGVNAEGYRATAAHLKNGEIRSKSEGKRKGGDPGLVASLLSPYGDATRLVGGRPGG